MSEAMTRFHGALEAVSQLTKRSTGVEAPAIDPERVPLVLDVLYGITDATEDEPDPVGSVTPARQWTGTGPDGHPITVKLWRDRET
jgi:hypothetical protein